MTRSTKSKKSIRDFDQMDKVNYFSQAEIKKFLEVIKGDPDDQLLFILGVELGPRVNEVTSLEWKDLDWENRIVRIWDEKKDRQRYCTIPEYVWVSLKKAWSRRIAKLEEMNAELKTQKKRSGVVKRRVSKSLRQRIPLWESLIFPISYKTVNRKIKRWAANAEVKRVDVDGKDIIRWHMLRHTYVVQSRRRGRDWGFLAQQTGNTVANLIESYGKLSMEDRIKITDETQIIPLKPEKTKRSRKSGGSR